VIYTAEGDRYSLIGEGQNQPEIELNG